MSQVEHEGLGVAGLAQTLDGVGVPQQVRPDPLVEPGPGCGRLDDLPAPLAVDGEEAVIQTQALVIGVAFQPGRQQLRAGHQPGFAALPLDGEHRAAVEVSHLPGGQGQGLADPQARLEQGVDEQGVPQPVPAPAGRGEFLHLLRGEIRDQGQVPGHQPGAAH